MIEDKMLKRVAEAVASLKGEAFANPWSALPGLVQIADGPLRLVVDTRHADIAGCPIVVVERNGAGKAFLEPLTRREREVAGLIAGCASNKAIARSLGISVGTVKDHVHAILSKLGLASRTELVSALAGSTLVASRRR